MTWHSVAEAAQLTGASERTVWRRIKAGTIASRVTADGHRLVGVNPEDLTSTAADLTAAAGAAAGALRAADGLSEAIRVLDERSQQVIARADQRADDAIAAVRRAEAALVRWRVATVALTVVMAAAAMYLRGPGAASATAGDVMPSGRPSGQGDNASQAAWHPPMALP